MFTGLVEEVGRIAARQGSRLRIEARLVIDDLAVGDSVAVDGCCLTVVDLGPGSRADWWEADLSEETLARTTLGERGEGDPVNLERPLRFSDRLGGHLVQGHVDGVGQVLHPAPALRVGMPVGLGRYVVDKGAVAVDGVSLTVVEPDAGSFGAAVVPHTAAATTLAGKHPGDRVNLELDVVAKYVERLLTATAEHGGSGA